METKKQRFVALDVVRGLCILFVWINFNVGTKTYPFLAHGDWADFRLIDWPFGGFILCMGFAMFFGLKHFDKIDGAFIKKLLIRSFALIGVGLCLYYTSGFLTYLNKGEGAQSFVLAFKNLRLCGIFQRLGFVYLMAGLIVILAKKNVKLLSIISGSILFAYLFILGFGHGYEFSSSNVCYIVDNAIFTSGHLYSMTINGVTLTLDPEGLLSCLPCIAQALFGFVVAKLYFSYKDKKGANLSLFALSAILIIAAILLSPFCPIIKKTWTTSYAILTSGITLMLISLVAFFTMNEPHDKTLFFFKVLGTKSLTNYVICALIAYMFKFIPINGQGINLWINQGFNSMCMGNEYVGSLIYTFMFVGVDFLVAWLFYKKKWFIRL